MAAEAAPAEPAGAAAAAASGGDPAPAAGEEEQALLQQRYGTTGFAKASAFAKTTCERGRHRRCPLCTDAAVCRLCACPRPPSDAACLPLPSRHVCEPAAGPWRQKQGAMGAAAFTSLLHIRPWPCLPACWPLLPALT